MSANSSEEEEESHSFPVSPPSPQTWRFSFASSQIKDTLTFDTLSEVAASRRVQPRVLFQIFNFMKIVYLIWDKKPYFPKCIWNVQIFWILKKKVQTNIFSHNVSEKSTKLFPVIPLRTSRWSSRKSVFLVLHCSQEQKKKQRILTAVRTAATMCTGVVLQPVPLNSHAQT